VSVRHDVDILEEMRKVSASLILLPVLLGVMCGPLAAQSRTNDQSERQGMLDRIMHPDRSKQSSFQGKVFNVSGGSYDKTFTTKDYAGSKEYGAHSYGTKGFVDGMKGWLGDHLFTAKKLPGNLEKANADAAKKFVSKDFKTKDFAELDKKSPYSSKDDFETKNISLRGKTQGAIDNNPQLQEAVRKGLSVDDVRKLLNKAP
jgi:hypothetical protein